MAAETTSFKPDFFSSLLKASPRQWLAPGCPTWWRPFSDEACRLPDGQPLEDVIATIDAADFAPPLHYLAGCVHPARFRTAASAERFASNGVPERLKGLKANASPLPPDQLDKLDHLDEGKPQAFAQAMAGLHRDFRLSILGGCCGTSDRHIEALAQELFRATRRPAPAAGTGGLRSAPQGASAQPPRCRLALEKVRSQILPLRHLSRPGYNRLDD